MLFLRRLAVEANAINPNTAKVMTNMAMEFSSDPWSPLFLRADSGNGSFLMTLRTASIPAMMPPA